MTVWHPFADGIGLYVEGRISKEDAQRQETTAREILHRLVDRPGLVLADEVGMGKTFVALAVASSAHLSDPLRRPVVVMVPPSLKKKWPRDSAAFCQKCLPTDIAQSFRTASADTAVDFLRLVADTKERRNAIIFLTHGAMHRGLSDGWVKLAMIQRALYRRHHTEKVRRSLYRCLSKLLYGLGWVESRWEDVWERLLNAAPEDWLTLLHQKGISPHGNDDLAKDSELVPRVVIKALYSLDATDLYQALHDLPQHQTATWDDRVTRARHLLTGLLKDVWRECLVVLKLKLPLLILDEAHHLKNAQTQLAGLFQVPEAREDAEEVTRGALGGVFHRMLFLTATPFQLGHHELCSVLERFDGIAWDATSAPLSGRPTFLAQVSELRERLDAAQESALGLDAAWGKLRPDDLCVDGQSFAEVENWWENVKTASTRTVVAQVVMDSYLRTAAKLRDAEQALKPWVIRHPKPREFQGQLRRERRSGAAIRLDHPTGSDAGLEISGPALLPFLLAARATVCSPESRPVFAEGLASSYEAFLHTRKSTTSAVDADDEAAGGIAEDGGIGRWYLEQLQRALPLRDHRDSASHPKVSATARRVLHAWERGEKVVVFCHYIATGRVLRRVIAGLMDEQITSLAAVKIGCQPDDVENRLESLGQRFFDTDSPVRRTCDAEVKRLLASYPALTPDEGELLDIVRRFLRTPSFLVRYFPLGQDRLDESAAASAFAAGDGSGLNLRTLLGSFFDFLNHHCGDEERRQYLEAIGRVQPGRIKGREALDSFGADELQEDDATHLLPNVRLVNGATPQETRQRLMLTFNSPFFPEVLIASSVLAEGVDLHRFCRYVIHHDLCWNPSTLEQRTGRVDRIGAKMERCGQPIQVYLPYLAETQDEKMYRVVMDRERWFNVVMGSEQMKLDDARTTEKQAQRVPLPASVAQELSFKLHVWPAASGS